MLIHLKSTSKHETNHDCIVQSLHIIGISGVKTACNEHGTIYTIELHDVNGDEWAECHDDVKVAYDRLETICQIITKKDDYANQLANNFTFRDETSIKDSK